MKRSCRSFAAPPSRDGRLHLRNHRRVDAVGVVQSTAPLTRQQPSPGRAAVIRALASLLLVTAAASSALAAPKGGPTVASGMPAMLDSRALQPGMKGHGLTVVRGQKIERFDVEVIGVLYNKLPDQDMILVRCAGLGLEHSGVVAGMSGSPVYVHDKERGDLLIGAVAYAFPFNKDPVAGVTPIADMLPELDRPLRPVPENQRILPSPERGAFRADGKAAVAGPVAVAGVDSAGLRPLAMPISVAGFDKRVLDLFAPDLQSLGLGPVDAASGGGAMDAPSEPFAPGSAISLVLARGDVSMAGVGTVTYVRGDRFIAFGHPFQGVGQVHLPVGNAHVMWILASQLNSFKMAVPTAPIGVLDIDRQPAVAGRIGPHATWVPITVEVRGSGFGADGKRDDRHPLNHKIWKVESVDQPRFLPMIAAMVVSNIFAVSQPTADAASVSRKMVLELEGHAPVVIEDRFVSLEGSAQVGEVRALTMGLLKAVTWNGFERLRPKALRVELDVREARDIAFLEWARLPSTTLVAGQRSTLRVGLIRPNIGPEIIEVPLPPLPRDLEGERVEVWIGPAAEKPEERPEPANIHDILASVRAYQPHNRLAVILTVPGRSLSLRGQRLTDLPLGTMSMLDGHGRRLSKEAQSIRSTVDLPWALNGQGTLSFQVRAAH